MRYVDLYKGRLAVVHVGVSHYQEGKTEGNKRQGQSDLKNDYHHFILAALTMVIFHC